MLEETMELQQNMVVRSHKSNSINHYLDLMDQGRPPFEQFDFDLGPDEPERRIKEFLLSMPDNVDDLLDFSGLNMTSAPPVLRELGGHLERLSLNDNQISVLPEFLGELRELRQLEIRGNGLRALPESIGQLIHLEVLDVRGNSLASLPESFVHLRNLIFLDVRENQLQSLPKSLGQLSALQALNLQGNRFLRLPPEILGKPCQFFFTNTGTVQIDPSASNSPKAILDFYYDNCRSSSELLEARDRQSMIRANATLEHFWRDGSAAVSVRHPRIGGLEFDISPRVLPDGVGPRDQFEVCLYLDTAGNVVSHQVPPGTSVVHPAMASVGSKLSAGIPPAPNNWEDAGEVARYEKEMEEWELHSGLAGIGTQGE